MAMTTKSSAPSRARALVFTSLGHFMNDGMVFFVPVVADILAKNHAISATVITAMLTVFYVASAGFGMVVGLVADSLGKRGLMIALGIFTLSIGLLGFYFSLIAPSGLGSDALAVVAALIAGVGSSFYHPLGGSVLQLTFTDESRGRALGVNGAFGSLGRALYPSLFFIVAALAISKANTVVIFAALGVVAAIVIASGLGGSVQVVSRRSSQAIDQSEQSSEHTASTTEKTTEKTIEKRSIRSMLTKSVVALMIIAFFRSMAFIGIVSWIPIYLTTQKHLGVTSQLGYTVTIMFVGGIFGQPFFGQLADRFDKRLVLAIDSFGSALTVFTYIFFSGAGAIVSLLFFGFFTFSGFPLLLSLVADYVPKDASTTGNALVWGLGSTGGQAVGPLVVGLLIFGSYTHLAFAFEVLATIAALTVLGTPFMTKTARRTKMPVFG
ncbi:MAG: MFS transporter [Actinobacteria bacterium]|nr:MFS transporter [Actinomycetota bacterium]